MLGIQLKYDLLMFTRELFYLFFIVIVPPSTYVCMGQLYGDFTYEGNLSYAQIYTPSFIMLMTFGVIFFAFGFEQVMNRATGVHKRIELTPVPQRILLLSSIIKSIILTSCGFFLIYLIGVFVYEVRFQAWAFLTSLAFFIFINVALLIMASALFSFFRSMNSALIFTIILFQIVMVTGGFAIPIEMMPQFVKALATINPIYHLNQLFISAWNGKLQFDQTTIVSFSYIMVILLIAFFILRIKRKA